jgi:adenylate cyclase
MTTEPPPTAPEVEAAWREMLLHGHRGRWSFLPADPRCIVCQQPFQGVGGTFLRVFTGYRASRTSPNVCNYCEDVLPLGGAEVDTAVLFADLRGSTAMGEHMNPLQYAALLNRFYHATSHVLIAAQSMIDKLVGDEIMALYIPAMGPDYRRRSVLAGVGLLKAVGYDRGKEPWLPVGVGINAGQAFVGKVGTAGVQQVTALGDTVNTAARIQGQAAPGELLFAETLYESVADLYPNLERRELAVRGREDPVFVRVLRPADL